MARNWRQWIMAMGFKALTTTFAASALIVTGSPVQAQCATCVAPGRQSNEWAQPRSPIYNNSGYSVQRNNQSGNDYRSSGGLGSNRGQSYYNAEGTVVARCLSSPVRAAVVTLQRLQDGNDLVVVIPQSSVRPVQAREYGGNLVTRSVAFELNVDQRYYDALSEAMSQQQGYSLGLQGDASRWFEKASRNFEVPFLARQDQRGVLLTQASYRMPASEDQLAQALGNNPAREGNAAGRPVNASAARCFGYGYNR